MDKQMRLFRSRLNGIPLECKVDLGEISLQKGLLPATRRQDAREILNRYNIDWTEVAAGTNRFVVKYEGYALKIALDKEGVIDNKQEFAVYDQLAPDATRVHEISTGGHLLMSSYCPSFTSPTEFQAHVPVIRKKLARWGVRHILGDVGINEKNLANWSIDPETGDVVANDTGYVFSYSYDIVRCICGNRTIVNTDSSFTMYKCTQCSKTYGDRDLRMVISQDERLRLFDKIDGFTLYETEEHHMSDAPISKKRINPDAPDMSDVLMGAAQMRGEYYQTTPYTFEEFGPSYFNQHQGGYV
jgi:hypothetical protein